MRSVAPSPTQEHRSGGALEPSQGEFCDLCGEPAPACAMTDGAHEASGLTICTDCIEEML